MKLATQGQDVIRNDWIAGKGRIPRPDNREAYAGSVK